MTVIILDNATVGMTGGQEVFVTGEGFIKLLIGLGVDPGAPPSLRAAQKEPRPKRSNCSRRK